MTLDLQNAAAVPTRAQACGRHSLRHEFGQILWDSKTPLPYRLNEPSASQRFRAFDVRSHVLLGTDSCGQTHLCRHQRRVLRRVLEAAMLGREARDMAIGRTGRVL